MESQIVLVEVEYQLDCSAWHNAHLSMRRSVAGIPESFDEFGKRLPWSDGDVIHSRETWPFSAPALPQPVFLPPLAGTIDFILDLARPFVTCGSTVR